MTFGISLLQRRIRRGLRQTGSGGSTASSTGGAPEASHTSGGTRIASLLISGSLLIVTLMVVLSSIL